MPRFSLILATAWMTSTITAPQDACAVTYDSAVGQLNLYPRRRDRATVRISAEIFLDRHSVVDSIIDARG
jgi:hypothetical protein